ncbi:MAG: helix-turn-helix transcriptional regulator [Deltaproteobacteria bacterium]|nr:helix-turn-helix transcriptional regulator [Deltaproteobacteria bacterium]
MFNENRLFGDRLKEVLEAKGVSGYKLAKITGIPQNTINDVKKGKSKSPALDFVIKVAKALNMTVSELIGETEEKYTSKVKRLADIAMNLSNANVDILIDMANALVLKDKAYNEVTATRRILKNA